MPSKRRATRTSQLQPLPAPSDYETDTANTTDAAPPIAPPPQRTNTELNLGVLRRYSHDVDGIVSIAPFAVVYTFSPDTQQWEKYGTEGTLFVCRHSGAQYPRYSVMILNRKSLENFITELYSPDDVEVTEEYVIIQVIGSDGVPQIYGLWIFSDTNDVRSTREIVAQSIHDCAAQAQVARDIMQGEPANRDEYGGDHPVGLDGRTQMTSEPVERSFEHQIQTHGQQLDLLQLFSKQPQAQMPQQSNSPGLSAGQYYQEQPMRLNSSTDTNSFTNTSSMAARQAQQTQPPPPQQNALLNLFKR